MILRTQPEGIEWKQETKTLVLLQYLSPVYKQECNSAYRILLPLLYLAFNNNAYAFKQLYRNTARLHYQKPTYVAAFTV